jgi:WD40 repeat protein
MVESQNFQILATLDSSGLIGPNHDVFMHMHDSTSSAVDKLYELRNGNLASTGFRNIRYWDLNDYQNIAFFEDCCFYTEIFTQLEDGNVIYCNINYLYICNPPSFNALHQIDVKSTALCVVQVFDGKVLVGYDSGVINVFEPDYGYQCIKTLEEHFEAVLCMISLSDGKVVSGSRDKTLRVWDSLTDFNCQAALKGHSGAINCLLCVKEDQVTSGSDDKTIRVWDLMAFKCLFVFNNFHTPIRELFTLSDKYFIISTSSNNIELWDQDYNRIKSYCYNKNGESRLIKLNQDRLAVSHEDRVIIVNPLSNFSVIQELQCESIINCLLQLTDGRIAVGLKNDKIVIWG